MNAYVFTGCMVLGAVVVTVGWVARRVLMRGDYIYSFRIKDKVIFRFPNISEDLDEERPVNAIQAINEFIGSFMESPLKMVEFGADDLQQSGDSSLLSMLQKMNYETVRLRLRAMCSLNPVVNLKEETGTIHMTIRSLSAAEFKLCVRFAANGQSIRLEKVPGG